MASDITIGSDFMVSPFSARLLSDSVIPILPKYDMNYERVTTIPGRIAFGAVPDTRDIRLSMRAAVADASKGGYLRIYAGYLNPEDGEVYLYDNAFLGSGKRLKVICNGDVTFKSKPGLLYFTVPLLGYPYFEDSSETSYSGPWTTTVTINNTGTVRCPLRMRFYGPFTNRTITVNGVACTYTGTIASGDYIEINTQRRTVIKSVSSLINSAISAWNDQWPWMVVGNNTFSTTSVSTGISNLYYRFWYI